MEPAPNESGTVGAPAGGSVAGAPQPMPGPQYPPRRRLWPWFLFGGLFLAFLVVIGLLLYAMVRAMGGAPGTFTAGGDTIGVIDIDGEITSADTIVDQLRKYNQDDSIKAIILHIDSPGGAAAPSQEIYHEVRRIREKHRKPIIASIESVGASGAYYIASGADKIYANDASVVGSIGVIMEWTNYGDLLKWAKLKPEVIHAGALKDAGDPTHEMTPEERTYFQGLVNNMYGQFVADVAAGRKLPPSQIQSMATGQVWTGQEALPLHLIDKEGGFRDALLDTAKSVGISGEPTVVKPEAHHKNIWDLLTSDADDLFPDPGKIVARHVGF